MSYVFEEVRGAPPAGRASAGRATPEEIVAIGRQIWRRVQDSGVAPSDDAGTDKLLDSLQNEFRDFNASFPLVLRWAVQLRKFSATALDKYLRLHATADLSTREGFLRLQAEYLVALYREDNQSSGRHDEKAVQAYRAALVKQLLEEDEAFIALQKEAEAEAAAQAAATDAERRQCLHQLVVNIRAQKLKNEAEKK
ncbi:MAG: hypothetical protein EBU23_12565 [Mycobacteriaceae bacterium]|nr:hypothetical protein [Mycobacteriaceae bacterium]